VVDEPVIVIGGGPAGLTAAYQLMKADHLAIVLEKSAHLGGIARTETYQGYRFDIGGHRFFTKVDEVSRLWREVLQADFLTRPRLSRIFYGGKFYYYPLKLGNVIANLGLWESFLILLSYLQAVVRPFPQENSFEEWVSNRFGRRLYRIFFKTYTEKVWGIPCREISADWAAQRIKGLSFFTAVRSALPGLGDPTITTLIEEFNYPRLGPGMLWEKIGAMVEAAGHSVWRETEVVRLKHNGQGRVTAVVLRNAAGAVEIEGRHFINSMPLSQLLTRLDPPPPVDILVSAGQLTYRDFLTVVLIVNRPDIFPDNWIYVHSPAVKVGRIQNFKNWSPEMVPDPQKTSLGLEYFCTEGDALWTLPDAALIDLGRRELAQIGLIDPQEVEDGVVLRQKRAYPVYTGAYKSHLERIQTYLAGFKNLQTVGRNGMHMYNNQDHSMLTAMLAVRNILGETHNLWAVNVERAYHEEIRLPAS
jgi:protoporphyrinogen oxidase